jgi:hypothetical protein
MQLVKKHSTFYGTQPYWKGHVTGPYSEPDASNFVKSRLNIILPFMQRYTKCSLPSGFSAFIWNVFFFSLSLTPFPVITSHSSQLFDTYKLYKKYVSKNKIIVKYEIMKAPTAYATKYTKNQEILF